MIASAPEPLPDLGAEPKTVYKNPNEDNLATARDSHIEELPQAESVFDGSGEFVKPISSGRKLANDKIDATLNFENAEVREVVAVILGDLLGVGYLIDPAVKGKVTLRNQQPLSRTGLLSVLETALDLNDAALIDKDGMYRVVPRANAKPGAISAKTARTDALTGYRVQVIPLQYIAASEMQKVLAPFISREEALRIDETRNLLIATGTSAELSQVMELKDMFDVDWLKGMSVALLPVTNTDAETVTEELNNLLSSGDAGVMKDVLRIIPVQRLNSVMVISPRAHYLDSVRTWLKRLDIAGGGAANERQLFVYRVQNGRAEDVADILRELFGIEAAGEAPQETELAPGAIPRLVQLRPGDSDSAGAGSSASNVIRSDISRQTETLPGSPAAAAGEGAAGKGDKQLAAGDDAFDNVGIVADPSRNALLILTTPEKYPKIEKALKLLDVPPLQVLLEATIVDVNLSGELSQGVQWFFDHSVSSFATKDDKDFTSNGTVGLPLAFPGSLSYSITNAAGQIRLLMNILETQDKLRVIASPSILVLDNETATIRVGDQQPISTTVVTEGGVVSSSVQFKDTGISLEVSPRVNDGGLVTLDVSQELTDTGAIDDATGQRAFLERRVKSRVAINSGESVVLGGLIRENNTRSNSGVPFLHDVPFLGFFFGQKVNTVERTELLVVLNATVVRNAKDLRELAKEFRRRMTGIYSTEEDDK